MITSLIRTVLFLIGLLLSMFVFHWPEAILIGLVTAYLLEGAVAQKVNKP